MNDGTIKFKFNFADFEGVVIVYDTTTSLNCLFK